MSERKLKYHRPSHPQFRRLISIDCTNCGRFKCKGKCVPRAPIQQNSPPAAASGQANAPAFKNTLIIPSQRYVGGSGTSASYPSSIQSATQPKPTRKRECDDSGASGLALQLEKRRAVHDQWWRFGEWLTQNRGVPLEYQYNRFQQPAPVEQQTTPTVARYQCPHCGKHNRDNSKLR